MEKCHKCGEKIVKFPVKKFQEKTFLWNLQNKTVIWKSLFKMDMYSIVLLVLVIFLLIGYKADIKQCEEVIEHPCKFCEKSNCCVVDWSIISSGEVLERNIISPEDIKFNVSR